MHKVWLYIQPKTTKNAIKMHQHYRDSNGAKYYDIDSD